uniref:Uncharacterized protein n=1 Tax=Oryza brachyantha TaxID=4533 RepID=J3MF10_ORYBR
MGVVEGMIIAAAAAGDVETASGFSSGSGSPASSSLTDEGGEFQSGLTVLRYSSNVFERAENFKSYL